MTHDATCTKLYRCTENIGDKKWSVEHTLHVQPEGYQEPHNNVGSQRPSWPAHWWDRS